MKITNKIFSVLLFIYTIAYNYDIELVKKWSLLIVIAFFATIIIELYIELSEKNYTIIYKKDSIKINTNNLDWGNILGLIITIVLFWFYSNLIFKEYFFINTPLLRVSMLFFIISVSIFKLKKKVVFTLEAIEPRYFFTEKVEYKEIQELHLEFDKLIFRTKTSEYKYNFNQIEKEDINKINHFIQKNRDFEKKDR